MLLSNLLKPFKFDIREAANGQEAIDIFDQWQPHLIWMDIRMPVISGLEATRYIKSKESGKKTIIIALTAHALEQEKNEILNAGCDDFIRKPFNNAKIYETIEKHLKIEFLRESNLKNAGNADTGSGLNIEHFRSIPAELIHDLIKAVEILNKKVSFEAIHRINKIDQRTGSILYNMVENFQYDEILSVIDELAQ